jgi:hypothetical protein
MGRLPTVINELAPVLRHSGTQAGARLLQSMARNTGPPMRDLWVIFFAIAVGFTASGIVAAVYKIAGMEPRTTPGKGARIAILVVAGPALFFEKALKGFIDRRWTPAAFWLATAGLAYWSLALGLLVLQLTMSMA